MARRLFLRRDPLRDRVVSAAALQLQLHRLPDRLRQRLCAQQSAQPWIAPAANAECHEIVPSDFAPLAEKWRAMWPEFFPK
jgi:hypothetical protein